MQGGLHMQAIGASGLFLGGSQPFNPEQRLLGASRFLGLKPAASETMHAGDRGPGGAQLPGPPIPLQEVGTFSIFHL